MNILFALFFFPLERIRYEEWKKEEADRVRNYTLLDVDLDKLRKTLYYYEKNTDCSNKVGSYFPEKYYEIFQLLPMDMSYIKNIEGPAKEHNGDYIIPENSPAFRERRIFKDIRQIRILCCA